MLLSRSHVMVADSPSDIITEGRIPENPERPACQVRILYQSYIFCSTEGNANVITKGTQGLHIVLRLTFLTVLCAGRS